MPARPSNGLTLFSPMATQLHHFDLFADYHQFYLQDEPVEGNLGDSWTPEATDRLMALAPGMIGVGTVRDMMVPGRKGVGIT